jgi:hypothetical protein
MVIECNSIVSDAQKMRNTYVQIIKSGYTERNLFNLQKVKRTEVGAADLR